MKLIIFIPIFILLSCQHKNGKTENSIPEIENPEIIIKFDRDEIRKLGASIHMVSKKMKEVILDTTVTRNIEDIKKIEISFKNFRGDSIKVELNRIIDTMYYDYN